MSDKREVKRLDGDGEVVRFEEQGLPTLDVWLEDETVWLTQKQMARLFACSDENIRQHIRNIYADDELEERATSKDFLEVRQEGNRRVARKFAYYNLDLIISVGFRVNTKNGVKFRQWATAVLKEYLLRGSVRDQRLGKLEKRMDAAERAIDTIIYTLAPALPENRRRIGFCTNDDDPPTKPYGKQKGGAR
ncbi:MAG: virulence RhuM family protein [Kiritimatiellae bacterium]|nr:virulence RhuM family protein [Kiritimatiellia bacterium]